MKISCCGSLSRKNKGKQNQFSSENDNHGIINNNKNVDIFNNIKSREINDNIDKNENKEQKIVYLQAKEVNGIIGLYNIGFSCYFNSAVQNLKNVFPLTFLILKNYNSFSESKSRFAFSYCKLIANLINQNTSNYFVPSEFFYNLQESKKCFVLGEQNDSSICVMHILNNLEKETKKIGVPNPDVIESLSEEDKIGFKNYINKSYSEKNSYILDYFYGFQQDIYECRICKNRNNNYFQGFSVLNLPIVTSERNYIINLDSIKSAIEHYQYARLHKNEEGFDCSKCKKRDIMTKTIIISYPKILIINFKRIGEQHFYDHNVEVTSELNINKYKYELIGFIKHIGGEKSGHNIAVCKNFFDNKWYEYDDHLVREITTFKYSDKKDKPDTRNGFLFFYKKLGIFDNIETDEDKNLIFKISFDIRNNYSFKNI